MIHELLRLVTHSWVGGIGEEWARQLPRARPCGAECHGGKPIRTLATCSCIEWGGWRKFRMWSRKKVPNKACPPGEAGDANRKSSTLGPSQNQYLISGVFTHLGRVKNLSGYIKEMHLTLSCFSPWEWMPENDIKTCSEFWKKNYGPKVLWISFLCQGAD